MNRKGSTKDNVQKLNELMREMRQRDERQWRDAATFKPGELTGEEEKLVKENGWNALNYIPQKTIQEQVEALSSSRPTRMTRDIGQELADRFDGAGYGLFLALIAIFAWAIASAHGWSLGFFCGMLMFVILELGYRLSPRD